MSSVMNILDPGTGAYAERDFPHESWLDQVATSLSGPLLRRLGKTPVDPEMFTALVEQNGKKFELLNRDSLGKEAAVISERLRRKGLDDSQLASEAFALVRELSLRILGMRHHKVQVIGGYAMLSGMIAEMETGEGKTLTATLPVCTAALAGLPVHVITVNDYLAERDANWMRPVYESLGLSVGIAVHGMEPVDRRKAYSCDITYCSNKELAFDYLKDRIALGNRPTNLRLKLQKLYGKENKMQELLLRGLYFGVVDEADSVLVDEARTPLIISGAGEIGEEQKTYEQALGLSEELKETEDFTLEEKTKSVHLTDRGRDSVENLSSEWGGIWSGSRRREQLAWQAIAAKRLYIRDQDYLIREGKIHIIDEHTGRIMSDRSWEMGLHQMIETKEGCEITGRRETLARISYQRYFRRYLRLCGMTGTAKEISGELWATYGLKVAKIEPNQEIRRVDFGMAIYSAATDKWQHIIDRIVQVSEAGRPVLVGTRLVESSEHLSGLLQKKGVSHQLLNARQDEAEANVVSHAGEAGNITIATNMAGRGTDIKLGDGVRELGGLHVILTELHDSKRVDRQFIGRCGRQGDAGSYEVIASVEDDLVSTYLHKTVFKLLIRLGSSGLVNQDRTNKVILQLSQWSAERYHARVRKNMLKMSEQQEDTLSFSGSGE